MLTILDAIRDPSLFAPWFRDPAPRRWIESVFYRIRIGGSGSNATPPSPPPTPTPHSRARGLYSMANSIIAAESLST
jgi:hypothetical protein